MRGDVLGEALAVDLEPWPEFAFPGGLKWRPTFGSIAEGVAVYVCETEELGTSIARRLRGASMAGFRPIVALASGLAALTTPIQEFLLDTGLELVIPDQETDKLARYASLARYAQEAGVLLDGHLSSRFIVSELRAAVAVEGTERGQALERGLAFMASQVPYWMVRKVNFETANEEIDVLIANSSARPPWNGGPYILIESKNWSNNVDRAEYDSFHMKVKERGGACRLGLFFAAVGFSAGFLERASHHGSEGYSIVPMSIHKLIDSIEATGNIEQVLAARVDSVVLDRQWSE